MQDILIISATFIVLMMTGNKYSAYLPTLLYLVGVLTFAETPITYALAGFISAFLAGILTKMFGLFNPKGYVE